MVLICSSSIQFIIVYPMLTLLKILTFRRPRPQSLYVNSGGGGVIVACAWKMRKLITRSMQNATYRIVDTVILFFMLVLCTQVNMMFVMLLLMCIHTEQA